MKKYIFGLILMVLATAGFSQKYSNGKTPTDRTRLSPNLSIRKGTKPHQVLMTGEDTTVRYFDADTVLRLGGAPDYYYATPVLTTELDSLRIRTSQWNPGSGFYITALFGGQYINNVVNKKVSYKKINDTTWVYYQPDFGNDTIVVPASSGGSGITDITYGDLYALYSASGLVPNQRYKIIDYKTDFYLNFSGTYYGDASPEEIIVQAISPTQFSHIAHSVNYPFDIIYYNISGTYINGSTKGEIYRRIDTQKNINLPFDFRQFKVETSNYYCSNAYDVGATYTRGQLVDYSGQIWASLHDGNIGNTVEEGADFTRVDVSGSYFLTGINSSSYGAVYVFGNDVSPTGAPYDVFSPFNVFSTYNFEIRNQPDYVWKALFYVYGSCSGSRVGSMQNVYCYGNFTDNTIDSISNVWIQLGDFKGNKIGSITNTLIKKGLQDSRFGYGITDNFINTDDKAEDLFTNNNIGDNFTQNIVSVRFQNNTIGAFCSGNNFKKKCQSNTIGLRFQNNKIGESFGDDNDEGENYGNNIGNDFKNNTIGNSFFGNTIGNDFYGNTTSTWFFDNHIGNNFKNNVVGFNFQFNNLPFRFYSNTTGDNFQNWNGQAALNGIDFTAITPTPPPVSASKYIIQDNVDGISWGYWDTGTFVITTF